MKTHTLILSCEHAVNHIPSAYQYLFHQNTAILHSHRAIDFGAQRIAQQFSKAFGCPLVEATTSRLLIDCNRTLTHPHCFSEFTKTLSEDEKKKIIAEYYQPYRQQVTSLIKNSIQQGTPVIHLSIHSFTPELNNKVRNADIGFLYDPSRAGEKQIAIQWRKRILEKSNDYRVRLNYPYRGISDGFVSALRKSYSEHQYLGLEIESNQARLLNIEAQDALGQLLISCFEI